MKYLAILAVLLIVTACSQNEEEQVLNKPFIGGVNGLVSSVLDGAPPSVITDVGTSSFGVLISLENAGESDVGLDTENPFVQVRLEGIFPEHFDSTIDDFAKPMESILRGARKNFDGTILPGEITVVGFQPLKYTKAVIGSEFFTILAQTCTDYSTHVSTKICLKDEQFEFREDDPLCSLRQELLPQNSGAPLQVVEAKQHPVGRDRVQVNFVVQNIGNGVFFDRSNNTKQGACNFNLANPDIYKALIVVHPVDPDNFALDCRGFDNEKDGFEDVVTPEGTAFKVVKFSDNSPRSFSCFLERQNDLPMRVFQELMDVDLYYRYGEFLEIPLLVQEATLI